MRMKRLAMVVAILALAGLPATVSAVDPTQPAYGGPLTGAVMNPSRAFGPAVVSWIWTGQLAFWFGPILGAVAAALLWDKVLLKEDV